MSTWVETFAADYGDRLVYRREEIGDDGLPTGNVEFREVPVSGVDYNRAQTRAKLAQARQFFADNFANWPTMTQAQKDTAMRQSQRALANLLALELDDLTTPGV